LELKFKISTSVSIIIPAACDAQSRGISNTVELFIDYINSTGIGNNWNGTEYETASSLTSNSLFEAPNNIQRAFLEVEEFKPAGSAIIYELSNDNGTNWVLAADNTFSVFTTTGKNLTYRVNLTSNSTNSTPRVRNLKISIIPSALENVSFDFNSDGVIDFNFTGILNSTSSPRNITVNFTASGMEAFLDSLSSTTGLFPIKITVGSLGVLEIKDIKFRTNVSIIPFTNVSVESAQNCIGDCQIKINVSYDNGTIVLSNLRAYFSGRENVSILAYSSNTTCLTDTKVIQYHYSKINTSLPTGILFYGVFPTTVNSSNVQPFGQSAHTNATISTPIFTIKADREFSWNFSIYESFAPAINNCISLESCTSWNKTSCINTTTTEQVQFRNISSTATNEIYNFWNLTDCNASSNLFLPENITFTPYCESCVIK